MAKEALAYLEKSFLVTYLEKNSSSVTSKAKFFGKIVTTMEYEVRYFFFSQFRYFNLTSWIFEFLSIFFNSLFPTYLSFGSFSSKFSQRF